MKKIRFLLSFFAACLYCQIAATQPCFGHGAKSVTVENCLASSNPEEASVQIFPNPATDFFVVKNTGKALIFDLFDLKGHKILTRNLSGETSTQIKVGHIPAGIYLAVWYPKPFEKACFSRIEISR